MRRLHMTVTLGLGIFVFAVLMHEVTVGQARGWHTIFWSFGAAMWFCAFIDIRDGGRA